MNVKTFKIGFIEEIIHRPKPAKWCPAAAAVEGGNGVEIKIIIIKKSFELSNGPTELKWP